MTRKHFEAIASAINNAGDIHRSHDATDALLMTAQAIADHCQKENSNFDRAKFIAACFRYQRS